MADGVTLGRVTRSVLSEQVSRIITEGLLDGRLRPGDRLVENDLADRLGISRSPIREALAELQKCGLVSKAPGRGAVIREWTVRDLEELFSVRGLLEGRAARLVVEAGTPDLAPLAAAVKAMRAAAAAEDYARLVELDLHFHRLLWEMAGNTLLKSVLEDLSHQVRLFLTMNWKFHGGVHDVARNHQAVIDALAAGDPDRAERVMQGHVRVQRMIEALKGQRAGLESVSS